MTDVADLLHITRDSTISEADRQDVLRSLQHLADAGNQEAKNALASDNLEPIEDSLLKTFNLFQARQQALYQKYKAEGLTAAECVARFRNGHVNGALYYSLIEWRVAACEKESGSPRYRHHLPELYSLLKATPAYDWPARELGEATMAKYFPHEWLTRELFEEMVELELYICDNSALAARTQFLKNHLKNHPMIERVREIKAKYPTSYGLIPDSLNGLVYSMMQG